VRHYLRDPTFSCFYRGTLCEARYMPSTCVCLSVCVCLCVCLSHSGIVSKRLLETYDHANNAAMTLVFWCQRSWRNSTMITPYGGDKCRWGGHFRRKTRYNSKTIQDRRIVSIKVDRKSYALYQMAMFPMTLGDSEPPNHPNFCIFRCLSCLYTW